MRCAGVESTDLLRHGLLPREPLEEVGVLQFYDLLELCKARLIERAEVLLSLRTRTTKRGEQRQVCVCRHTHAVVISLACAHPVPEHDIHLEPASLLRAVQEAPTGEVGVGKDVGLGGGLLVPPTRRG